MDARDLFGQVFLQDHEAATVLRGFRLLRGDCAPSVDEQAALLKHVARIRFEAASLDNVMHGYLAMDLTPDGRVEWRMTPAGERLAATEREGFGLPPRSE